MNWIVDMNKCTGGPRDFPSAHRHWMNVDTGILMDGPRPEGDGWIETRAAHCQNGGDVCLAGNRDGICCPEDSCDIDDGMRTDPREGDYCVK